MAREQLQSLTEPMYYILLALLKPMHGYEIMQTVSAISDQKVRIGAGTLYALLTRFEKEGLISQISDDGRRKIYEHTAKGREILEGEYTRLKDSLSAYEKYISELGFQGGEGHEN